MSFDYLKRLAIYFTILVIVQIPLLHDWVYFGRAFPFPYVGFILLMPLRMPRGWLMVLAFMLGLIVDIFSNTPGMHASASVFVAFMRQRWFGLVLDSGDDDLDLTISHLGWRRFMIVILPMLFLHHVYVFTLENEGFQRFWRILSMGFWSAIFSFVIVCMAVLLSATPKRR